MSRHSEWLKWPEKCSAIAVRNGEQEPCEKWAIAVAWCPPGEFEYHEYPVCKHHARGRPLMNLKDIIRIAREERE